MNMGTKITRTKVDFNLMPKIFKKLENVLNNRLGSGFNQLYIFKIHYEDDKIYTI